MASSEPSDWYDHPFYYDIVFDEDTGKEADFLEAVLRRYGKTNHSRSATILEPACGTGRLVLELARRSHRVDGFDLNPAMLRYARKQRRDLAPAPRKRATFRLAGMQSFRPPANRYDLAFCLLSTFKYLLTESHAVAHLRRISRSLKPGGLYVLGLHLADYRRRLSDHERWVGERDGVTVICETDTDPADPLTRQEVLTNRLKIRRRGVRRCETIRTRWTCRTYDAGELAALIGKIPELEIVACHDFSHQIDYRRELDDSQEDIVLVLRKRR